MGQLRAVRTFVVLGMLGYVDVDERRLSDRSRNFWRQRGQVYIEQSKGNTPTLQKNTCVALARVSTLCQSLIELEVFNVQHFKLSSSCVQFT